MRTFVIQLPRLALRTLLVSLLLATSTLATAQTSADPPATVQRVLPGAASAPGAFGSHWQSDVDLSNLGGDATVTVCYLRADEPGTIGDCQAYPLPAGGSVHFPDIVASAFDRPGTAGLVTLTTTGDPATLEARMNTHTTVTDPESPIVGGRIGAAIASVLVSDLVTPGTPALLVGASDTFRFRQNIAIYNVSATAADATLSLRDHYGNEIGAQTVTLQPLSFRQTSVNAFFGTPAQDDGYVVLTQTAGETVGAFLSIVDNVSNAPTVNLPILLNPSRDTSEQIILWGAHNPLFDGTLFQTDLTITNLAPHDPADYTISFYLLNQPTSSPAVSTEANSLAGENKTYPDVIGEALAQPAGTVGALRVTSQGPLLAVTSRTYRTVSGGGQTFGTIGMSLAAVTQDDAATNRSGLPFDVTNSVALSINGIADDPTAYTTLILANATTAPGLDGVDAPTTGYLSLFDPSGKLLGSMAYTLRSGEKTQLYRVGYSIAGKAVTNARLEVSVDQNPYPTGAAPAVWAMATTSDRISGQGCTKLGQKTSPQDPGLGEKVVRKYLDPLKASRCFLSNNETYCMLQGCDGVTGIRQQLAMIFAPFGGGEEDIPWDSAQDYDNWMNTISNGVTGAYDPELYHGEDPFMWDSQGGGIQFQIVSNQAPPTVFLPGTFFFGPVSATMPGVVFKAVRSFLVDYVNAHPSNYSLDTDPTWQTRDPN
jgi:hypothetical protein